VKSTLVSYFSDFLSLVYPNLCVGCDDLLPSGNKYLCPKCHYNLPKTNTHLLEVPQFKNKFMGVVPIKDVLVYCYFNKHGLVQKLLQGLKYGDQPGIGEVLGNRYGTELALSGFQDAFDVIVPVPIHRKRRQERGYNQSEYFARGLSKPLHVQVNTEDFVKAKHIDSLTKKSKVNRIVSVKEVFSVLREDSFRGKRVLLVDDVLTTGSTLMACAEQLEKTNPHSISIATIGGLK